MAAATRPISGQSIESAWGGQVHDAAVAARGVTVSSAPYVSNTAGIADLNAVTDGDASMVDLASNEIILPVAGIWELGLNLTGSGLTGGAYRADLQVNVVNLGGVCWPAPTSNSSRGNTVMTGYRAAGDRVRVQMAAPLGGTGTQTLTISLLWARLVAQDWNV